MPEYDISDELALLHTISANNIQRKRITIEKAILNNNIVEDHNHREGLVCNFRQQ
jgi:hypothetical protein